MNHIPKTNCLICSSEEETEDHLIFSCFYILTVLRKIKIWLNMNTGHTTTPALIQWISHCGKSVVHKKILAAGIGSAIYHVWWVRN